ncbi:DUF4835 family protein [Hymenobacter ginsengisoli]|uniref:DUF4835 family protein n=1 Tax=Hymenobacter ginsengisoli TaxID=1051626 RepID=A0ABP8Q6A9_9BACT|nr:MULTISPECIES: DUF4835 family protein [unclassified Hymenobacter]MBO2030981.1 DUF4835 family protein [Hymenobacter sp. BT559]
MRKIFALLALLLASLSSQAQELNAQVAISLENVTITDPTLVAQLQKDMTAFLNTRTWTRQPYRPEERIKLRMFVGITGIPQNGTYQATMRLIATRPVYGTGYETNLLNINDRSFNFNYTPQTALDYSPSNFVNNLSSLLAFYAYMVIGTDQDTFSRLGGSTYYDQARNILQYSANQNVTNEADEGWRDTSSRNRYWLLNNLTDPQLEAFRTGLYAYYRQGMDIFIEKPDEARTSILTALTGIQKANTVRPSTLFVRAFFDAKADEITNIFRTSTDTQQKQQLITLMTDVDPGNLPKYQTVLSR